MRRNEYYEWLLDIVGGHTAKGIKYLRLLRKLFLTPFKWTVENDSNRAVDGIELRDKFFEETDANSVQVPFEECSVLEMLVALAMRCESDIMADPLEEMKPERWFWEMIDNLGFYGMTDDYFDEEYVEDRLDRWMEREYSDDGLGGLFPLKWSENDQRKVEIWFQMCAYLDQNFG